MFWDVLAKRFIQTFWFKKSTKTFHNWNIYPDIWDIHLAISVLPNVPKTFWLRARHFLHICVIGTFGFLKCLAETS